MKIKPYAKFSLQTEQSYDGLLSKKAEGEEPQQMSHY